MKIVYCTHSLYNPGGMERVLVNKLAWLAAHTDWELRLVTTDQGGRQPFYPLPERVGWTDLGIGYSDDNAKHPLLKIAGYLLRRRKHRRKLTELLHKEKADIVVSLYPSESSFIPSINDGSKKVLELHFCKFFRLQYGRRGLLGAIDRWRTRQDERIVRRFDRFVVLTEEDRGYWGNLSNIEVIPNAALFSPYIYNNVSRPKRVIAVGRLDYQKGFDRLLQAWAMVQADGRHADWKLDIFGQGEWHDMLTGLIESLGISATAHVNPPTKEIAKEYASSSLLAMSSHYEGFPMVMIEAMATGLPVVSFCFKCGPRDIIRHEGNGLLVGDDNIEGLAAALKRLMDDEPLRQRLAREARKVTHTYSEEAVMAKWLRLFDRLSR